MQNFHPYKSIIKTAKCLDYRRLGKQRVESYDSIYLCYRHKGIDKRIEFNKSNKQVEYLWKRYKNHPAVLMYINYINYLKLYYNTIRQEWISRGYNNSLPKLRIHGKIIVPHFIGNRKFHNSHKSNLLRKNSNYYSQFNWKIKNDLPYFWPITKENFYK